MSAIASAYNEWSHTYDAVENKTRDLDAQSMQQVLENLSTNSILELGCGTGKNTVWLAQKAAQVTAVDFSEGMLAKAKEKAGVANVRFQQADITAGWNFGKDAFDLATCNLILEHIQNLAPVFEQAALALQQCGHFFISELHPFKQYAGSKARFEKEGETVVIDCFVHHISEYLDSAFHAGFELVQLDEWFDADNKDLPRLVSFLFKKK